jgi:trimethylamine--corrinoid protein Co-methyltransferase
MNRAIINFGQKTLDTIHKYSLELLQSTGIKFLCPKALGIFKKHGLRTDGDIVFFEEKDIHKTMATVPSAFTIKARNPSKSIRVGGNIFVMAPGYGPPLIIEPTG